MNITKQRRLSIYLLALNELVADREENKFDEWRIDGVCCYLHQVFIKMFFVSCPMPYQEFSDKYLDKFTEFNNQIPDHPDRLGSYWWQFDKEGNDERVKALKKAIKQVEKKIK